MNDFGLRINGEKKIQRAGFGLGANLCFLGVVGKGGIQAQLFVMESEWPSFPSLLVGEAGQIRHA